MYIEERTSKEFEKISSDIMMTLTKSGEEFTADEFYKSAKSWELPPREIKRLSGKLFREFQAAGYIQKTDRYKLSRRNGSTPLPIWITSET